MKSDTQYPDSLGCYACEMEDHAYIY